MVLVLATAKGGEVKKAGEFDSLDFDSIKCQVNKNKLKINKAQNQLIFFSIG